MKLIVGLGNPGSQYAKTRHNVGFCVIDRIADAYGISVDKFKFRAFVGEGRINGEKVMLLKPQTFMNLSGESVKEAVSFYKIPLTDILVTFDDTSLPIGSVRIRQKGSAGGHNGVKNIISHLATDQFARVKVGIGEKPSGWDLADYVLGKFSEGEQADIAQGIGIAAEAAALIIEKGCEKAMNQINQKPKSVL